MDFKLREWRLSDAKVVAEAANNKKIADNLRDVFPFPYTENDAREFIESCASHGDKGSLTRAIEIDGVASGSIGVFVQTDVYKKSAELGYWLSEKYWGCGIMTAAVKRICKEAFDKFDIVRIYAEPFSHNNASRRVLEKAGFKLEGIMRDGVYKNGNVYSYCMYSLLREDFLKSDRGLYEQV